MKGIPALPQAWYVLGLSKEFKDKPVSYKLLGKKIVVWRNEKEQLNAQSANCPHMGVNLANGGKIKNGCLECPLHGWRFDDKGNCVEIPLDQGHPKPEFARLKNYPVKERHGIAFIWNGVEPLYPLPFFEGEDESQYEASKVAPVFQETSWFGPAVNAFDIAHFIFSHNRIPYKESDIDLSNKYVAKVKHYYRVIGKYWFEKLLAKMFGDKIELTAEIYSGATILTRSHLGKFSNYMITHLTPCEKGTGRSDLIIYKKKGGLFTNLINKIMMPIQLEACRKIFQDESDELKEGYISEKTLHPVTDKDVKRYLNWFKEAHSNSQIENSIQKRQIFENKEFELH